ncbi:MAG: hypothetical protein PVF73_12865 [Bacteroidales bacterium]
MRKTKYTQEVTIENNHIFSGMTPLCLSIIFLFNLIYIADSKAFNPPISVKAGHVTCYGKSDGAIKISISDPAPAQFTIELRSNTTGTVKTFNETSPIPIQISDLKAGKYTIWYTDKSIRESLPVTIETPEKLNAGVISIENIQGENEMLIAAVRANPGGGTPPYIINWSENTNNQEGPVATDLPVGIYRSTINDANNCGPVSATIFLFEPEIEKFKKETTK